MSKYKDTKEYTEKLGQIKLSESSRARIMGELESYVDLHSVSATERVGESSRSSEYVGQAMVWQTVLSNLTRKNMQVFAIIAIMFLGGGTSLAAQGSVPGDILYPIKVSVNENVRSALAVGANAEARLAADLLAERVKEAEQLEAEGKLSGELAIAVESNIATQYEKANSANAEAEAKTDSDIKIALGRFASLTTGGSVVMEESASAGANTKTMSLGMPLPPQTEDGYADDSADSYYYESSDEADTVVTTSLALEPVDVSQLQRTVNARLESLHKVLETYEGDMKIDVYAELNSLLDESDRLMMQVMVQSSTDVAREILFEVSDLVGGVEASLSIMGEVTIDPETGAIVDIDFNNPPPEELNYEVDPVPMPLPMPVPPETDGPEELVDEMFVETEISI